MKSLQSFSKPLEAQHSDHTAQKVGNYIICVEVSVVTEILRHFYCNSHGKAGDKWCLL